MAHPGGAVGFTGEWSYCFAAAFFRAALSCPWHPTPPDAGADHALLAFLPHHSPAATYCRNDPIGHTATVVSTSPGVETPHDHGRSAVDQGVEAAARRIEPGICGGQHGTAKRSPQLGQVLAGAGRTDRFTHVGKHLPPRPCAGSLRRWGSSMMNCGVCLSPRSLGGCAPGAAPRLVWRAVGRRAAAGGDVLVRRFSVLRFVPGNRVGLAGLSSVHRAIQPPGSCC